MADTINLGIVTAYGAAVEGGYTGTYNDFKQHIADFANVADEIEEGLTSKADLINGKVPSSELPSYVDDVIEGYYKADDGKFYEESTYETEIIGESGKIYVDLNTNDSYRWSGSTFVKINNVDISGKADKVANATNGNLAGLDANGNIIDSGIDPTNLSGIDMVNGVLYEEISIYALKFSSDSDFTLSAPKKWNSILEYSIDSGDTWTEWDGSQLSGTDSQSIYLRGIGNTIITGGNYPWTFTGKYCTGNIENILDYQKVANGEHPVMGDYCYNQMFLSCSSLTTPPTLPATILTDYCYRSMFSICTALTTAPELPATTLADYCYSSMFYNCTSLTKAPELPAMTLADYCYYNMFASCRSLTIAPELPATILAENCYYDMFWNCKSLTQAPELPAIELADSCYMGMFQGCTSLIQAPELPATTLAEGCYSSMFSGCSSLITAPSLPATTLAEMCYYSMFQSCSSLTTLPALPATTLANVGYGNMFESCRSIKISETQTGEYQYAYRIPTTGTVIDAGSALADMFMDTGGTFTDTPEINTTYYTTNQPV